MYEILNDTNMDKILIHLSNEYLEISVERNKKYL